MLTIGGLAFYTLSIQWDNSPRLMIPIWCVGLLVLWRLRRLHITVTYILSFILFAALRTPFTHNSFWAEVAPLTGPMYQLFAMFMVTDPPTTVSTRRGQIVVVFLVAAMESLLRLNQVVHAPYYALFLVGPTCLVFDRWRRGRQPAPALAPARAP
jgi:Na+-translocating ferredoxin:NAD+ oxidoreductase RnfD subunit